MPLYRRNLRASLQRLAIEGLAVQEEISIEKRRAEPLFAHYQADPCSYAQNVLRINWWEKQQEVARALVSDQRVFVQASHNVGKTFLAGGLVNWHFDCFSPSITKTTAPTSNQVEKLTWKEVRLQRQGRGMLPKAPAIEGRLTDGDIDPAHFAGGYTARNADSFQGDHEENLLIIFEEATGIHEQFWTAADGMLSSGRGNRWLAIMNPTDTTSYAYQEFLSGTWKTIQISAFDHPNITAELWGRPKPYPKAISLSWLNQRLEQWCMKLGPDDAQQPELDFCWPPLDFCEARGLDPVWYRPDARFEGRVMGRWPSSSSDSIWSDGLFRLACVPKEELIRDSVSRTVQIGCDVARFGDDETTIHVRQGGISIYHEYYQGRDTAFTAGRLKDLCIKYAPLCGLEPFQIPVLIDDSGVGGGVVDQKGYYHFIGIGAGTKALDEEKYDKRRSELWFTAAERCRENRLDLSLLDPVSRDKLRKQLMSPIWKLDSHGRRVVEAKEITKKRLKRSPDDADALNLAYAGFLTGPIIQVGGNRQNQLRPE